VHGCHSFLLYGWEGLYLLSIRRMNGCNNSCKVVHSQKRLCSLCCGTLWFLKALSNTYLQPFILLEANIPFGSRMAEPITALLVSQWAGLYPAYVRGHA